MIDLIGIFYSDDNNATIDFRADGSFTLIGMKSYNTKFGRYYIGESLQIPGYWETIVLIESTRPVDILRSTTFYVAINCIDGDTFETISIPFAVYVDGIPNPAIFKRLN